MVFAEFCIVIPKKRTHTKQGIKRTCMFINYTQHHAKKGRKKERKEKNKESMEQQEIKSKEDSNLLVC